METKKSRSPKKGRPEGQKTLFFVQTAPKRKPVAENPGYLWSDSTQIPFYSTLSSHLFEGWLDNWTQSRPACILFGPTSSGKSRLIETFCNKKAFSVMEVDCASIADVASCIRDANEATQSRQLGSFLNPEQAATINRPTSMVVLEHIDSLIGSKKELSPKLLDLINNSKVPMVMTAYTNPIRLSDRIIPIYVAIPPNTFEILMSAKWATEQNIKNPMTDIMFLLTYTYNDMRRTALQLQVMGSSEQFHSIVDRCHLSLPSFIAEVPDDGKAEAFADVADLLALADILDDEHASYLEPFARSVEWPPFDRDRQRTNEANAVYASSCLGHRCVSQMERVEAVYLSAFAARHAFFLTRNRLQLPIGPNSFNPDLYMQIASWDDWPAPCL